MLDATTRVPDTAVAVLKAYANVMTISVLAFRTTVEIVQTEFALTKFLGLTLPTKWANTTNTQSVPALESAIAQLVNALASPATKERDASAPHALTHALATDSAHT